MKKNGHSRFVWRPAQDAALKSLFIAFVIDEGENNSKIK